MANYQQNTKKNYQRTNNNKREKTKKNNVSVYFDEKYLDTDTAIYEQLMIYEIGKC